VEGEETMTRSQWTAALVFGSSILLIVTAWRLYAEGFTWRVAVTALMAVLFLLAYLKDVFLPGSGETRS
jgi:hypothetical protein